MDIEARIAQFENMAQADPENEMAHYSLGGAYAQAERFGDAAESYVRVIALAPGMSKAYQLAGEMYVKAGQRERAAGILTQGYEVAAQRGDRMPKTAIAELLKSLGRPVPQDAAPSAGRGSGVVSLGRDTGSTPLERPPFRGPLGEWIFKNITKEKWSAWIGQGTKVINELRLDLSQDRDSEVYDTHMREYLGIDDELYEKIQAGKV